MYCKSNNFNNRNLTDKRIEWIDSLKGFLLLCICLSHFGFLPPLVRSLIYPTGSVWVPAFFFLSGLLYSSKKHPSFNEFVFSKTKTLLIPYLFFFLVFTLCDWNIVLKTSEMLKNNFQALINGGGPEKATPIWFVIRLFCANVLYFLLERNVRSSILRIVILIVLFVIGYYLHLNGVNFPLSLDIVFSAMLFLGIAHIFKSELMKEISFLRKYHLYAVLVVSALGIIAWYTLVRNPDAVMAQNKVHNLFFFFLTSLGGTIAVVFLFSTLLEKLSSRKAFLILQYISKNGIVILATHCYCVFIVDAIAKFVGIENQYLIFLLKILILVTAMHFIIVPLINNKFYFFVGKKRLTYKQSLKI